MPSHVNTPQGVVLLLYNDITPLVKTHLFTEFPVNFVIIM